eukprot:scaffold180406_cov36-Prasinocladus_malaysianus.AAC.1
MRRPSAQMWRLVVKAAAKHRPSTVIHSSRIDAAAVKHVSLHGFVTMSILSIPLNTQQAVWCERPSNW